MSRKVDPRIREHLLKQSLDYCIEKGFSGTSLRALAKKIGTSHRMLIYHFGSSEALFEGILEKFRRRQVSHFITEFNSVQSLTQFEKVIRKLWANLASQENRNFMISYLEIQVSSIRSGKTRASSAYLDATLEDWLAPISSTLKRLGLKTQDSRLFARLILSGGRGLILDALGAGSEVDSLEVEQSFKCLAEMAVTFASKGIREK